MPREMMTYRNDLAHPAILYAKIGPGNCGAISSQRHCGEENYEGPDMGAFVNCEIA
jgi:hypothetical protein